MGLADSSLPMGPKEAPRTGPAGRSERLDLRFESSPLKSEWPCEFPTRSLNVESTVIRQRRFMRKTNSGQNVATRAALSLAE